MRFLLSGAITLVVMLAMSFAIADPEQAHSTRLVGVIVGAVVAAIPIYDIDRLALWKRSVLHFAVMVLVIIPCLMWSGWYEWRTVTGFLELIGTFLGFGVAGWLAGFFISQLASRARARARNQDQDQDQDQDQVQSEAAASVE